MADPAPPGPIGRPLADLEAVAAAHDFSGSVRIQQGGETVVEFAHGFADLANGRQNMLTTRFATASVTKGFTALTVMSLVESGDLTLDATARSVLGDLVPGVADTATIEHLLGHHSGIGDYLDETLAGDIDDYVFGRRSAHTFASPSDYVELLDAEEQRSTPGEVFAYNNSGYVVLSLLIELVAGSYHDAVDERVLAPAGLAASGFFRSDDLPENAALGYLIDGRTNVFHLPVIGAGDGGIYLTLDDLSSFWQAGSEGKIVSSDAWQHMTTPVNDGVYGLGFWVDSDRGHVWLEGMDAGVSTQTGVLSTADVTYSILANTSTGAWPVAEHVLAAYA